MSRDYLAATEVFSLDPVHGVLPNGFRIASSAFLLAYAIRSV
jgi:hypothetical protein